MKRKDKRGFSSDDPRLISIKSYIECSNCGRIRIEGYESCPCGRVFSYDDNYLYWKYYLSLNPSERIQILEQLLSLGEEKRSREKVLNIFLVGVPISIILYNLTDTSDSLQPPFLRILISLLFCLPLGAIIGFLAWLFRLFIHFTTDSGKYIKIKMIIFIFAYALFLIIAPNLSKLLQALEGAE
jgi:hypothetical protein